MKSAPVPSTVLRTGCISTLHPSKGTGEELWFLAANLINPRTLPRSRSLQATNVRYKEPVDLEHLWKHTTMRVKLTRSA
jgi:hypothetical protein